MCGICGIFDTQGRISAIARMNNIQGHRGPDDEGYLFANVKTCDWETAGGEDTQPGLELPPWQSLDREGHNLALGSRRLAILDLSTAGHMPMSYYGGRYWITYNGEVYNYLELKSELESLGHRFASDSDTEVILAAYAEWGTDCLPHFNGMFAFAIWDGPRQLLFCARDRFGIKPFYYYWNGDAFIFGSEIKSVLEHPQVPRTPNNQTIYDYLVLGLSDHTEHTFFENIFALTPAHYLIVQLADGRLTSRRWWQAEINPEIGFSAKEDRPEAYSEFAGLLKDAVRLRLRSDVPVGTCLSGGLDSSAVVTLANQLLLEEHVIAKELVGEHQKTFTARNREHVIDEYAYSNRIVQMTGAEENLVYPSGERLWQELESFVWHMDEPVNSTSQYPQWNVMRLAKGRGVTVLLDGQGGDEILAGYHAYLPLYLSQIRQQSGPAAAARALWQVSTVGGAPARDTLWEHVSHQLPWRLRQLALKARPPRLGPGMGGTGLKAWQLAGDFMDSFYDRRWQPPSLDGLNGLVGALYKDLTATNLPKLLRYEDRNSMAFSLETRLPFLDYRLVEHVFALPLNYRIHQGWTKWILRRAMQDQLPPEITWRRSKLGFPTPELQWLQKGGKFIRDLLQSKQSELVNNYISPIVKDQISRLSDKELASTPGLWRVINLIIWMDIFFPTTHFREIERTDD